MNRAPFHLALALILLILASTADSQDDPAATAPEAYRSGVRRALSGSNGRDLRASHGKLDEEERVGWAFLLANMPPHQLGKVTEPILTEHLKYAYRARRELAWTKALPEEVFLHYVVPILSGDEKIEAYRKVLWDEIVPRLRKKRCKSLEQAALEVNKFCGSKVSFKATPPEDSSPLEVMKRGYGRCEEEGIFFNAVARTAGVPARIASTPYWTFKASNHAWCEVYTGGGRKAVRPWHFVGACEPSGKLDQAWFVNDVKRAAVVLSRAIGKPEGDEILSTRGSSSVINSTKYYTKTCRMTLKVVSTEGEAVRGAALALYIWNEVGNEPWLKPAFEAKADASGELTFDLGPGDYVVQAKGPGGAGFAVARSAPGKSATCEIVIGQPAPAEAKRKAGPTGVRVVAGPGADGANVGISKLASLPWKPQKQVQAASSGAEIALSTGLYLLQTGKRRGDATVNVTLQVVEVRDGETVTVRVPGKFPKRPPKRPDGSGIYVLTYPR